MPHLLRERVRTAFDVARHGPPVPGGALIGTLGERAAAPGRRMWLARYPVRVRPQELRLALGGLTPETALRGPALDALATVGAWEQSLASLHTERREDIVRRADMAAAHTFDLLGSGPTDLGPRIDWQQDFKSGRSWPLLHRSRLTVSYVDASDIKVPWELSRFQHLPLLAVAFRITGELRYLEEIGSQLLDWIATNPVEFGVNWKCTMDVAIRAANWIAALTLVTADERGASAPWLERVLASLLLHGRFIRSHLEWATTRGNHYLSDVVGLLIVAAVFSAGREGRAWSRWATRELLAELDHQVRADGCDHEASLAYHRLVTELFICGLQAADTLMPEGVPARAWKRLDQMLSFTAAYTRPDGLAPQIGDADDGRFLPLEDYGSCDQRSHTHLFSQAAGRRPRIFDGSVAFPQGGWFVMRAGAMHAVIRCGDVGVGGVGCHAHCDQLSFELSYGTQPLITDPGSYLYTADPSARRAFRSTAMHATLEIDRLEQNPIFTDQPFRMNDHTRSSLTRWSGRGAKALFIGRHHGYERLDRPAVHERRIDFDGERLTFMITDTVLSEGSHSLCWHLPLAPCVVELDAGAAIARFASGVCLEMHAHGLQLELTDGWYSPSYGVRHTIPILRASRTSRAGEDVTNFVLRISDPMKCELSGV